jgi:hypothetical protein
VAREQVKVGRRLRDLLPEVNDAVVGGRITSHHAAVLAGACHERVAEGVVALQADLIALAEGTSFDRWRSEVRGIVELLDEDGGHDPAADLARNQLNVAETIDGITHLTGQFLGEHALTVRAAIDAKADELFHRYTRDHETCPDIAVPTYPTLRALALAELCRAGGAVDVTSTRPPRPEVTLVVQADEPDTNAHDGAGTRLADGTTRVLRCDPDLYAVVIDSLGQPIDLGRHVRLATTAQRRALAVRYGGCVWPGCDRPFAWCDAHHVEAFEHGGRTDLANLAPLCRAHHGVTHRAGWTMHTTPDGWHWWRTPTGHTFWSQRHQHRRTDPTPTDEPP